MRRFNKILIANRGEIAVRIIRSAKKLGIQTVAVYSEIDRYALHVSKADESYCIGQQELSETYLNIEKIIDVAKRSGCGAIHPGYGFLAENSLFVEACDKAGITFIGPHEKAIRLMGNKIESREFVKKLNIPMTQGITGSPEELLKNAKSIPLPILVKAAAGGGGKGMRIVHDYNELENVLESTSREAKNYFGDESVFIEKYVEEPRHIEFQILGDNHGNVVHLFERECTIQRRYQKIIEESPSPTLTDEVRNKMGESAVAIAKAVDYNSAGTVEFLVDKDLNFYFLEMNTRLQVEHPITERVVGIDLVREQINIANGLELTYNQDELAQNGHAIECRIYAEDPDNNFLPSPGLIQHITEPLGFGVRHDGYVYEGYEIPLYYDPLISKLIVWGKTRQEAIDRMKRALFAYKITGVKTTIKFLEKIMNTPDFVKGNYNTHFIDKNKNFLEDVEKCQGDCKAMAIIAAFVDYHNRILQAQQNIQSNTNTSEWKLCNRKNSMSRL